MRALATCSSSSKIFARNKDSCFCSCRQLCPQIGIFQSKNLAINVKYLHLICLERKPPHPVHAASTSGSHESQQSDLEIAAESFNNQETYEPKTVHVKIQLNKECSFGEQFAIVGDDPIFGIWDPENAMPLDWSDGHVWILELDIPIGTTIQFKFILKDINGEILWQPGPDRILTTWETNNTIVVIEDWEDPMVQKLVEEEPSTYPNTESIVAENLTVNSETLIAREKKLIPQSEELVSDVNNRAIAGAGNPDEDPITADKPIAMVADDISSSKVYRVASSTHPEEMLGNKETLINHDEAPFLVPGLPPLSTYHTEPEIKDEGERSNTFEVENQTLAEQKINETTPRVETIVAFSKEEQLDDELELGPLFHNKKQNESESLEDNSVVQNDIQWGRKTIRKLLTNFGFL
ncbi:uncharacterized protein LOC126666042 [Mercurialis annua]|uniref:uncharacterized protein LOC126666042 n=1 Tax=Mercurialis annua TaxID=3986 RepID=UPI00215FE9EE|nr:uncharacterized protein LOC126666042 [Mercurialis annua]